MIIFTIRTPRQVLLSYLNQKKYTDRQRVEQQWEFLSW